jgi:hypothetical protein
LKWSVAKLKRVFLDLFGNRFVLNRARSGYVLAVASRHLRGGFDHHVTAVVWEEQIAEVHTKIDGVKVATISGSDFCEALIKPNFDPGTAYKLHLSQLSQLDSGYFLLGSSPLRAALLASICLPLVYLSGLMRWGTKNGNFYFRLSLGHRVICFFKVLASLGRLFPAPQIFVPILFKHLLLSKPSEFLRGRGGVGFLFHKQFKGAYYMWRDGNTILINQKRSVEESGIGQMMEKAKLPVMDALPLRSSQMEVRVIE